jgi:pimeloyl-ACP methyl ester carboxylesterase/DNA-binding CsgD family transcriptional regulator
VDQEIRFCTTPDGVRLAIAGHGRGPGIVKVAHWFTHVEHEWRSPVWRHWWAELGRDHRLVRYDLRGCGLSDRQPPAIDLESFVSDLEAVVEASQLDRFALLGISGGGATAVRYAVRHPDRVSHLVLCGAYARGRDRREASPQQRAEAELLRSIVRGGWDAATPVFRRVFSSLLAPDATEEEKDSIDELMRLSTSPSTAARLREVWSADDLTPLLAEVAAPALVVHSRHDQVSPFEEARLLAAGIPGARLLPLESRDHALLAHEPAWPVFLREVRAFLGEPAARAVHPREPLTAREVDVLELVADGLHNDEIADRLGLSPRTVERHLANSYAKLELSGRSARAAAAAFIGRESERGRPGGAPARIPGSDT